MSRLAPIRTALALSSAAILAACSTEATPVDAGPGVDAEVPLGEVTYHEDVRPILADRCVSCHVGGGIAPFPLDTYETAAPMATRIAEVTRARLMPPFLADNSGECQTYHEARWLSDRELDTLEAWDEQGEPLGDATIPAPEVPPLPSLDGDVISVDIGVDYAPDTSGPDDYRCFVVEAPFETDWYLTGQEVHPGNDAIVHHVILFAPFEQAAVDEARALDAAEDGAGYTCFGDSRVTAFPVGGWAPGTGAMDYPEGTGVRMTGGWPLIVQLHYNTAAGSGNDRTRIDLEHATSVARMARFVPVADFDMVVEPRLPDATTSDTWQLSRFTGGNALPLTIYGALPHMHTRGRTIRVDHIRSDGEESCLIDVPRWDFDWQLPYMYERPIVINTEDSLRITCSYDTTDVTEPIRWGEGTGDEMCISFFYVVIAGGL